MSSPMVDRVRELPQNVDGFNHDTPMSHVEDTGFPFEDDIDTNDTFRSQLDDIAQRHPEFAQHLTGFPFASNARSRTPRTRTFPERQTARNRFDSFGFDPFEEEPFKEFYQQNNPSQSQYYPSEEHQSSPSQEPNQETAPNQPSDTQEESQPASEGLEQEVVEEKVRRPCKNIQQSNTVDLGQIQEDLVDDRSHQRSMSAPPADGRKRFISSINIPINASGIPTTTNSTNMGPNNTQQTPPPSQSHFASGHVAERVIPIHVEGRDEPIVPKKATETTSQPRPSTPTQFQNQHQSQPQSDKFFGHRPSHFTQFLNRDKPFGGEWGPTGHSNWFNKGFQPNQQAPKSSPPKPTATSQNTQQRASPNVQQQEEHLRRQQQEYEREQQEKFQQHQQQQQQQQQQEQPKTQQVPKLTPIDEIKNIQKDVSELIAQVEQFKGKPRDKEYLYLDEMFTRNLIKLDNIDTQGQESIRQARKEAIKCIEKTISILESRAQANVEPADKNMEVDETKKAEATEESSAEENVGTKMEVESTEVIKGETKNEEEKKEDSMEVSVEKPNEELKENIEEEKIEKDTNEKSPEKDAQGGEKEKLDKSEKK